MMKQPWGAVQINKALCAMISVVGIGMIFWGCSANDFQVKDVTWKTYKNDRSLRQESKKKILSLVGNKQLLRINNL
jgi:hypothetical protein